MCVYVCVSQPNLWQGELVLVCLRAYMCAQVLIEFKAVQRSTQHLWSDVVLGKSTSSKKKFYHQTDAVQWQELGMRQRETRKRGRMGMKIEEGNICLPPGEPSLLFTLEEAVSHVSEKQTQREKVIINGEKRSLFILKSFPSPAEPLGVTFATD